MSHHCGSGGNELGSISKNNMGQKIHPVGFRLGITQEHRSRWYADTRKYSEVLKEDYIIRQHIEKDKTLETAGISKVRIERKADQIELEIHTARPGVVVGRQGSGIEVIRQALLKKLGTDRQIRINVIEIAKVDADAALIAEFIAQQLSRRVSFRRVVRQAIQRAQRAEVKGIKIQVGGRLNGAEIARTEQAREGSVPLHTLRADIDYASKTADTTYGIIGVKVWVFKGEIIPGQENLEVAAAAQPKRRQNQQQRRRQQFDDRSDEG
jgi:small subunit ribosomal protein S3